MSTITHSIKRATVRAQRQMNDLDADALEGLQGIYESAAEEIRGYLDSAADFAGNVQLSRLQSLLAQVEARLAILSNSRNALLDQSLPAAASLGTMPFNQVALNIAQAGDGVLTQTATSIINDRAVNFVREFVGEDGLQLSDRIWRLDMHARDKVKQAIEMGVIQGAGAAESARQMLTRGEIVPIDVQEKIAQANAQRIGREAASALMTGQGSPMDNAMRLFRTELNRAHGEAYIDSSLSHPQAAGVRFNLSPAHPRPDICDLHAEANLYGLGKGVYPTREKCPWPAHPNTLSYVTVVFKDEVTDEDRAGKETPTEALDRLTPQQQLGVLGKNKLQVFKDGQLTQGMIKAPWKAVQKRIGQQPSIKRPAPVTPPRIREGKLTLDGMLQAGRKLSEDILERVPVEFGLRDYSKLREEIARSLSDAREINAAVKVENKGRGAEMVQAASRLFPNSWTRQVDQYGKLYARFSESRGYQYTIPHNFAGKRYNIMGRSGVANGGEGFIQAGSFSTSVHELVHRIQHVIPQLDDYFQDLHHRRTQGEPLKRLSNLLPGYGYPASEVAREDHYINPYQGKVYTGTTYTGKHGALEVMTMAMEDVLGGNHYRLMTIVEQDREMFDLVMGVLFNYEP